VHPGVNLRRLAGTAATQDVAVAGPFPLATSELLAADCFPSIQTREGDDVVDSSGLVPGRVQLIGQ